MPRESPYPGLHAFRDSDREFFSGRADDAELIVANLFAARLTLLYGPSGVGKSSVLHAGVLPRLAEREDVLAVAVHEWGAAPARTLSDAVAAAAGFASAGEDLATLVERATEAGGWRRVMLVLDQFEHTVTEPGADDELVESVAAALRRPGLAVSVLVAIREESLAGIDRFEGRLPGLFDSVLRLEYLDRRAGADAIRLPLEAWEDETGEHVEAEDGLVEAVLDAVPAGRAATGIETAQLQLVMGRVWAQERKAGSRVLRRATYDDLGGADAIVTAHVDEALSRLSRRERNLAAISLDRLVTPSGARIAYSAEDLASHAGVRADELRPVLESLAAARVLRPVAGADGGARFEVYHELLADAVLAWLTEHRARREATKRVRNLLLGGALLLLILGVAGALLYAARQRDISRSGELSATARRLLAADADPQAALALALEAARTRRTKQAEIALRAALVEPHELGLRHAAHALTGVDVTSDGSRLLTTEEDGPMRLRDLSGRPLRSVGDAIQAVFCPDERRVAVVDIQGAALVDGGRRVRLTRSAEVVACSGRGDRVAVRGREALSVFSTLTGRRLAAFRVRSNGAPGKVASSADGRFVATPVAGGIAVFELGGARRRFRLVAPTGEEFTSLAFDRGGLRLIAGGADGTVVIFDRDTGEILRRLEGHRSFVNAVAFSADGSFAVSAGNDRTARVWDGDTGVGLGVLRGHEGNVVDARFAGASNTVITASSDGTLRGWGSAVSRVQTSSTVLTQGFFTLDGRHLVTATLAGAIDILDPRTGASLAHLQTTDVEQIAASRDGRLLAILDNEGSVEVLDSAGNAPPVKLRSDAAFAASVRPDGGAIALALESGTLRIVARSGSRSSDTPLSPGPLTVVAYSPDGRLIAAAAGSDGQIALVDGRSGRRIRVLRAPGAEINALGFSPDGRKLIAGANDGALIWDDLAGEPSLQLRGHLGPVQTAAFSGGAQVIATASEDGETRVWDAATGDLLTSLPGSAASFGGDAYLFTVGGGSTGALYTCGPCGSIATLIERAHRYNTRHFTREQLDGYLGG